MMFRIAMFNAIEDVQAFQMEDDEITEQYLAEFTLAMVEAGFLFDSLVLQILHSNNSLEVVSRYNVDRIGQINLVKIYDTVLYADLFL